MSSVPRRRSRVWATIIPRILCTTNSMYGMRGVKTSCSNGRSGVVGRIDGSLNAVLSYLRPSSERRQIMNTCKRLIRALVFSPAVTVALGLAAARLSAQTLLIRAFILECDLELADRG